MLEKIKNFRDFSIFSSGKKIDLKKVFFSSFPLLNYLRV
jgi:hypothetical protein